MIFKKTSGPKIADHNVMIPLFIASWLSLIRNAWVKTIRFSWQFDPSTSWDSSGRWGTWRAYLAVGKALATQQNCGKKMWCWIVPCMLGMVCLEVQNSCFVLLEDFGQVDLRTRLLQVLTDTWVYGSLIGMKGILSSQRTPNSWNTGVWP